MTTQTLMHKLRADGFDLSTDGLAIHVAGPPDKMTPQRRDEIMARKWELIALIADTMPDQRELMQRCESACTGLNVDPADLCQWLIDQNDPGWCTPKAVRRWAEIISQRGFPNDEVASNG